MPLRAFIVALLAAGLVCAGASARPHAAAPLDVELAIDTTGSMGPSIRRLQHDAEYLVRRLKKVSPAARVAVVQFKDAGDTPEYELLQPMTGSPQAVDLAVAKLGPGGGGDNPEAYNVVFRNSYTDDAVGWRNDSRKLVVVVGDAEPHGAGSAGFGGCLDASPDPHALRTRQELIGMKVNQRTLIMVRQASTATVDLHCYETLAAASYGGGGAQDAGSDLIGVIVGLVEHAAAARVVAAAPSGGSRPAERSAPAKTGRSDRTPPHVVALKSGGNRGTNIRLVYRVSDASGRSSERVAVYAGTRLLTESGWAPFGPSTGKAYFFDFPSSPSMSGTYTFCVTSRDPSGNVSKPSCAPLLVF